jgi:4-diphosphocytidyl-2-C-methyl-D-erythritol kinase
LGLQLGADVPFFLADAPAALATGIGEILQPVAPLHGYSVLMVNPGFPVSTRWVYQSFALTKKEKVSKLKSLKEGVVGGCAQEVPVLAGFSSMVLSNDLETVTIAKYPELARLKDKLLHNGARAALMSGSGPTVFGLFAEERCAEACYALLKRRYPYTYLVAPVGEK